MAELATIFNRVCTAIRSVMNEPQAEMTRDTTLDSLGIDSLARMELTFRLEREFVIKGRVDDADWPAQATVGDIVTYIQNKET